MATFFVIGLKHTAKMIYSSALVRVVLFAVLLSTLVHSCDGAKASKASTRAVTAVLDAKWRWTPLVIEISEFMAEEKLDYFWSYVDRIADIDPEFLYQGSDREYYDLILSEASQIISQEKIGLLKLSLALRTFSPTVEMFHQIALTKDLPDDCSAVIEVNSLFTCDPLELEKLLNTATERNRSDVYKFDHHFMDMSTVAEIPLTVVLYGELGSAAFREFHFILKHLAKQDKFDYVIRHYLKNRRQQKVRLSGYGVELAIKSTEYKAQDDTKIKSEESADGTAEKSDSEVDELDGFIFSKLKSRYPDKNDELEKFRDTLLEESQNLAPLKVWQLQELGLQAAQRIMSSPIEEALRVMRDTAQNFPALARSMVKIVVDENVQKEVAKNQNMFRQHLSLSTSDTALFVNGIFFDPEVSDIFTIMDVIKEELSLIEQLHRLGVKSQQMERILSLDLSVSKEEYAVDIRDSAIRYINDLESDRIYSSWPSSITEVLRPTYPGMMRSIRKNIFHVVAVVDPSVPACQDLLKLLESFYVHRAPLRVGLLFAVNQDLAQDGFTDAGIALLNAFNFVAEERGNVYQGLSFLTDVYAKVEEGKAITSKIVIDAFKGEFPGEDYELIFGLDSDYDTGRKLAWEFLSQTGLRGPPEILVNGVRLPKTKLNGEDFEEVVLTEIMKQTAVIQKAVYTGELTDAQNILDYMMERENVVARLNDRVLNATWKLIDVSGTPIINVDIKRFSDLPPSDKSATLVADLQYFTAKDDFSFRPITTWVATDLGTEKGRSLLRDAIEQTKLSNEVRVGVLHNPADLSDPVLQHLVDGVEFAARSLNKKRSRAFVDNLLKPETVRSLAAGETTLSSLLLNDTERHVFQKWQDTGKRDIIPVHAVYCQRVLQFERGQLGLVVNGRILGPFESDEQFTVSDFNLLERHGLKTFGDKVRKVFEDVTEEGEKDAISDLAFRVSALVLGRKQVRSRVELKYRSSEYSVVKVPPRDAEKPAFNLTVIVDPLSRGAQKVSPILLVLQEVLNCHIWVFLNPQSKLSEMPLKSFYRLVLEPEIQFTADDKFALGPMAKFQNMLVTPLFTMHMDTAENWLVELVKTPYDLDNIHLEKVDGNVYGEFELEHLLIEGHCFDQDTGSPPRGLQFILGTPQNPRLVDTIVMANLGYFQLKAAPGAWFLNLRKGRSSEIYNVVSHEGTDSPVGSTDVQILVGNFRSHIVKIKVDKKPGKHHLDLLSESEEEGQSGIWNSITSTFGGKKGTKDSDDDAGADNVLNIFSLASGHLYERLLRIMMLSLLKNTKTPVKFWFLKNYLSPKFKDLLPMMAAKYDFQYELVQYKWPRWLHQQTEKQRTIWGYKILFLDVLFPLSVKKIIFVDADLIVRADMKELRDFDLGGAPYGYTPFCESKKEMDGYRFWKSGYWATHLQGRRYHISALYVVDLKKFRRIAAGDRLRGQYQGLSQDPNSLSNLDQDLPNNMIHQVAIKSLPQEWLWCETWCSDSTKAQAKTIDLCNNPQTKESKLSNAMRTSPEWIKYDEELRNLIDSFEKQKVADKLSDSETKGKSEHKHGEL